MGSKGRPIFDLNEPPPEDDEDTESFPCVQPQRAVPLSNSKPYDLLVGSNGFHGIVNNHAFSHASSVSGFQPFIRSRSANKFDLSEQKCQGSSPSVGVPSSTQLDSNDVKTVEKEEGEWSDAEETTDVSPTNSFHENLTLNHEDPQVIGASKRDEAVVRNPENVKSIANRQNVSSRSQVGEDECSNVASTELDIDTHNTQTSSAPNLDSDKVITPTNSQEDTELASKLKEARGVEASHSKYANKRPKIDHRKEAMLGKKRSRQTMFLNVEDVPTMKSSAPKRQNFPTPLTSRTVKEMRTSLSTVDRSREKSAQSTSKDNKQIDLLSNEGSSYMDSSEPKPECNVDLPLSRTRRLNSSTDLIVEATGASVPSQNSLKQPTDLRQHKSSQIGSRKPTIVGQNSTDSKSGTKKIPLKKQPALNNQYQDTSVERLLREATCEKLWHNAEEAELQCVPGQFESVEEYVGVFEPLLFEECRAQLYSTWEEQTEMRDPHIKVFVKHVERRERGWYDVNLQPDHDCKWTFKEGDVAVLSSPYPRLVRSRGNNNYAIEEGDESENCGRVAGTIRRHIPIDTRDRTGATLHFYVGDINNSNSKNDDDHILRRLQLRSVWFLTVLGSLATTQREYIALHAFRRLNTQMQNAILQPSPEHFPKYEEQTPVMPECFTTNFVDHLHRTFNEPQLAAIHYAATHTAAGTSNVLSKSQDPWPFTLVQGPPGTGKTHTVWGMLNVIHLVQYQHYYTALLKKLAPESYKKVNENNADSVISGSIDEVLQSMDQNLFRTLPKLCPKPRMLVCAPSNAATDELLSRVLDRGFIDGEMKVYRPDVARVGVDTQTRAAQAVSVERRTEQLLMKSRDEILGWMHQLRARETQLSQQIFCLQRELTVSAAAGRTQGTVGVDPDVLMARDQNRDTLLQNLAAVVENRDKVLVEMSRLIILEGKFRAGGNFNLEEARASLEASFANEAEIVFTTLSSSGRKLFSRLTHGFDMVVIDEAAQASEVGVLPPLSLGAARCVLVGDPQQLPATVISKAAGTLLYSRSLFERFQQAGCPTMLLSVQYRMHPQIRHFPSRYFYQGRLTDSESIINLPDEPYYKDHLLKPYIFYDITHGRESHRGGSVSYENIHEAQFCLRLYEHLQKVSKSLGMGKVTVGIITPYKLQLKCLQREFKDVLNSEEGKDIYINTVDAFQGQERDVIIMSCVRASGHGVGFVADIRRMNVALTRARRALWVMGNANSLIQSEDWAALVSDAKERKCYMHMESLPKDFLAPKPLPPSALSNRTSNNRSFRPGMRHRHHDAYVESRSGTPSEEEDKSSVLSIQRNGSYHSLRPPVDSSLDDFDQSGDKSRDAWQHGIQKKKNSGVSGKRD